eukprot:scaffold13961_cov176-Amphora_coffeaeformis.AAC.4
MPDAACGGHAIDLIVGSVEQAKLLLEEFIVDERRLDSADALFINATKNLGISGLILGGINSQIQSASALMTLARESKK